MCQMTTDKHTTKFYGILMVTLFISSNLLGGKQNSGGENNSVIYIGY